MSEAVFPIFGTAFVFLVLLPVCAVLSKGLWILLDQAPWLGPLAGPNVRYLLLTGSSSLPLAWLLSAGLHQAESGRSLLSCLFDHDVAALCFEPALFAVGLVSVSLWQVHRELRSFGTPLRSLRASVPGLSDRLLSIADRQPQLQTLVSRVRFSDDPGFAIATVGWLRPRVVIGAGFAEQLTDPMLAAALAHEAAHVRARDPLRLVVLRLCLAVNPVARPLLERLASQWAAVRETHCDRDAVLQGAKPLCLAEAIVRAARPGRYEGVGLGPADTLILGLRVQLLLALAEQGPTRSRHRLYGLFSLPTALALVIFTFLLPHQTGTAALDLLHTGVEHSLAGFWR